MNYNGVGIVILHPDMKHVLMVLDSRSRLWSFPKGRAESGDPFPLATGIREVLEETDFEYVRDYVVTDIQKRGIYGNYLLYDGVSLRETLITTSKPSENVDEIAWVPICHASTLNKNYTTWQYCVTHGWES